MTKPLDRLVAIDGVNGNALIVAARELLRGKRKRSGLSNWDASGIFGEVLVAEDAAGSPSARTLLLLYASDLAFRLRWEIRPAIAAGRRVIAVPYVDTAIAFGEAAGIDPNWLADVFGFAPEPAERHYVLAPAARSISERKGFVEFGCEQMAGAHSGTARLQMVSRAGRSLKTMARRASAPRH